MNHSKYLALLSLLALASCSDQTAEQDIAESRTISFSYTSESSPGSRGSNDAMPPQEITLMSEDSSDTTSLKTYVTVSDIASEHCISRGKPIESPGEITGFKAYSFFHPAGNATPLLFFSDETVSSKGSNLYATANSYFWPTDGGNLSFYTLVGASDNTVVSPDTDTPGSFKIEYSIPSDATAQNDLLLATTAPLNTPNTPVPLSFRHLCSQVTFVIGNKMQRGTIKSITLSGINSHGVYKSSWSTVDTPKSFTLNVDKATVGNEAAGTPIAAAEYTLMMLPQTLGPDAKLTVVFDDAISGTTHTLTASLANDSWLQGKKTTYHIGITPRYEIDINNLAEEQDAHYVIIKPNILFTNVALGTEYNISISAIENGSDETPSVQLESDVNEYAKSGMWTDKLTTTNNVVESARGSQTLTGKVTGTNMPIYIFLPENVDANGMARKYKLDIWFTYDPQNKVSREITQLAPAWNGSSGWEQFSENSLAFGFDWDYIVYYGYLYSSDITDRRFCQNLIDQNEASSYASVGRYSYKTFGWRYYIQIDYSKLNSFGDIVFDNVNGLDNTQKINDYAGLVATRSFEKLIETVKKSEAGHEHENTFRIGSGARNEAPAPTGSRQPGDNNAVSECLKKNKYNLKQSLGANNNIVTTPEISEKGIVWYLPAVDQFNNLPSNVRETVVPAECWSSTVLKAAGSGDRYYTKAGDGTDVYRMDSKKIRAVRKNQ